MKSRLLKLMERERIYLSEQKVGSEEYCASLERLTNLEKQLAELEQSDFEADIKVAEMESCKKDKLVRNIIEGVKVGAGVITPFVGLVWITAVEKDTTFTGALREYTKYFLPKKMN